ncbi:MAG: hypothetical protein ACR2P4_10145 [Gammaproteobacteria bacterium]
MFHCCFSVFVVESEKPGGEPPDGIILQNPPETPENTASAGIWRGVFGF